MAKRWIQGLVVLGGVLVVLGCGPVPVGGDDDDDDNQTETETPTSATGTFSVSAGDPNVDLFIGAGGIVDVDIQPVDGYTGTVTLTAKSVVANLGVTFEEAGNAVTEVTLDGTNTVTVQAIFASTITVNGQDVTVPPAYNGNYELEFSDGTDTAAVLISAKVGPVWVYMLNDLTVDDSSEPWFPHEGTISIPYNVAPVFVHNGAARHRIHFNGAGVYNHMNNNVPFANGAAWNPVDDSATPIDLLDPVSVANVEANGVLAAGDIGASPNFYCHGGLPGGPEDGQHQGAGSHNNVFNGNPINISIIDIQ